MPSTIELIDKKTGLLPPEQVIADQVTQVISSLYVIEKMLPEDDMRVKELIEDNRTHLCAIRSYLEKHFTFKA